MGKWKKKAKRNKKLAKYWCEQYDTVVTKLAQATEKHSNEVAVLKASSTGDQSEYIKSLQDQINMLLEENDKLQYWYSKQPFTIVGLKDDPVEDELDDDPFAPGGPVEYSSDRQDRQSTGVTKWLKTPEEIEELVKEGYVWRTIDEDGTVCLWDTPPALEEERYWANDSHEGDWTVVGHNDFSKPWKESLEYIGPKEKAPEGAPVSYDVGVFDA